MLGFRVNCCHLIAFQSRHAIHGFVADLIY